MMHWLSTYAFTYETTLCYMLQASEYSVVEFWRWWRKTPDFRKVSERGGLVRTAFGRMLYLGVSSASLGILAICGVLIALSMSRDWRLLIPGAILFVLRPFLVTLIAVVGVAIGKKWYIAPQLQRRIAYASEIFANHKGVKVAVLGSYGKTTMKELLATVLSEGLDVAATPATKNVAISHAKFAQTLTGKEKAIVVEFGEGKPGDTKMFTDMFKPDYAVVTGLAPAHLDAYGSLEAVAEDFAYVATAVTSEHIYINGADDGLQKYFSGATPYNEHGVGQWKTKNIAVTATGVEFALESKGKKIPVHSKLLGRHQVGPLSVVAALAAKLDIPAKTITEGMAKTVPYEHRMQPRHMSGALLIDDTYNGNIEGIKAGIALLKELPAKRRIYVTPGLVEQGAETESIHRHIGDLLSVAGFDEIVLMKNSATAYIADALKTAAYAGVVKLEDHPLEYYQNIEYHSAAGDVIMMQNDLPDRYQ